MHSSVFDVLFGSVFEIHVFYIGYNCRVGKIEIYFLYFFPSYELGTNIVQSMVSALKAIPKEIALSLSFVYVKYSQPVARVTGLFNVLSNLSNFKLNGLPY